MSVSDSPDDNIVTYLLTASAGVRYFCPTCNTGRVIWSATTRGGDTITACSHCQRIVLRRRTDSIPLLEVNANG